MKFEEFIEKYQKEPVEEYPNRVLEAVENPVVSVRVSVYNHAPYIRQCLDSILAQEMTHPWEVCIGEDESNDGTREICIEYAKAHPGRIRLFLHKRANNISINDRPSAKFQGFYTTMMCRGEYIAVCEGDDYWTDDSKISVQSSKMEEYGSLISFHKANRLDHSDGSEKIISDCGNILKKIHPYHVIVGGGGFMPTASIMYRKGFEEELLNHSLKMSAGDYLRQTMLAMRGGHALYIPIEASVYNFRLQGSWTCRSLRIGEVLITHLRGQSYLLQAAFSERNYILPILMKLLLNVIILMKTIMSNVSKRWMLR